MEELAKAGGGPIPPAPGFDERVGIGLARLHASPPQSNRTPPSWTAFWSERRLAPRLHRARDHGFPCGAPARSLDRVLELVPQAPADVDLAMTELFGGFGARFYRAYAAGRAVAALRS